MANNSSSGTEFPQNPNTDSNDAVPIVIDDLEEEEEEEEEEEDESEEEDEDEEYMNFVKGMEERQRTSEDGEACSSGQGSQENEWNQGEIGGLFCPICMEAWSNDGDHHIWYQFFLIFLFIFNFNFSVLV